MTGIEPAYSQGGHPDAPLFVEQPYGGYIVPGSTLADMSLLVSQWNTTTNTPYDTQSVLANLLPH
jgi:hypothetical protein